MMALISNVLEITLMGPSSAQVFLNGAVLADGGSGHSFFQKSSSGFRKRSLLLPAKLIPP